MKNASEARSFGCPALSAAQQEELLALLAAGNKILAVKRYREIVPSASLADAKTAVETLSACPPRLNDLPAAAPTPGHQARMEVELLECLRQGAKIAAIKRYRELRPGTSLAEAKTAVEEIARRHGIQMKSGCFVATAVFEDADHPAVNRLRRWRDVRLGASRTGAWLIRGYELAGPVMAQVPRRSPILRRWLRGCLTRLARWLVV